MDTDDIFRGVGVEITLKTPQDFLKIRETLTRIGVASRKDKTLTQSCHILHKQGRYAVLHFKELFVLDGKQATLDESDLGRRNSIAGLLAQWGLVTLVKPELAANPKTPLNEIKIVAFRDKSEWTLVAKYTVGKPNAAR